MVRQIPDAVDLLSRRERVIIDASKQNGFRSSACPRNTVSRRDIP